MPTGLFDQRVIDVFLTRLFATGEREEGVALLLYVNPLVPFWPIYIARWMPP